MSDALKTLQKRVGCFPDGSFGPNTAKGIADYYELTPLRAAHILGQSAHESGGFKRTRENLNYSAGSLYKVFRRYFPTMEKAEEYARQPEKIANYVYMDEHRSKAGALGNVFEGDGALFLGRGFLQCTGRANYRAFAADMRLPEVMQDPSLVENEYAFESAMWYFNKNKLWDIADKGVDDDTIELMTRRINGGRHGLEDRKKTTKQIYGWLDG